MLFRVGVCGAARLILAWPASSGAPKRMQTPRGTDSLVIQHRRRVIDSLYLRCHIPSLRQCITPFTAQTGFDVPEYTQ